MIISQTPLRISFAGGGTDFKDYYSTNNGAVVSAAINKYIYVVVKKRFDSKIRIGYTKTESVDTVDEIQHELVREAMRVVGVDNGIEICTMADIPSEGSGLGSSSTVTVGLLNALYAYKGKCVDAEKLAQKACEIEISILGKPIGKQDQYIAAYGGFNLSEYFPDDTVKISNICLDEQTTEQLCERLILFYTGVTRKSANVLTEQKTNISSNLQFLDSMREDAYYLYNQLNNQNIDAIGDVLNRGWKNKKKLAKSITNPLIDEIVNKAYASGTIGCKIAGAGGGGFLLAYIQPEKRNEIRQNLSFLREMPIKLVCDGSKIMLNVRN